MALQACIGVSVAEWNNQDCSTTFKNLSTSKVNKVFDTFYQGAEKGQIWVQGVNDDGSKQEFQSILTSYCADPATGGRCKTNLQNICSSYDRTDTLNGPIQRMCGCYLNDEQYNDQIVTQCDPVCASAEVPYYTTTLDENQQICLTQACVIDNVTIQAQGSSVGEITFSQVCPNCTTGCRCVIGDINLIVSDSRFKNINIEQNCSGSSTCYATDVNGNRIEVDCAEYIDTFGSNRSLNISKETQYTAVGGFSIGIALVFLGLLIAALIITFMAPSSIEIETKENLYVPEHKKISRKVF